jgi:hypothetical protein
MWKERLVFLSTKISRSLRSNAEALEIETTDQSDYSNPAPHQVLSLNRNLITIGLISSSALASTLRFASAMLLLSVATRWARRFYLKSTRNCCVRSASKKAIFFVL